MPCQRTHSRGRCHSQAHPFLSAWEIAGHQTGARPVDSAVEGSMLDWSLVQLVNLYEVSPSMTSASCGVFTPPGRGVSLTKWLGSVAEAKPSLVVELTHTGMV